MEALKHWYDNLEKREQVILIIGVFFVLFYVGYGVLYLGLVEGRDRYKQQVIGGEETLAWVNSTVQEIQSARSNGSSFSSAMSDKSLSQISELAAKKSQIKISRFQPKSDIEAQLWLDKASFNQMIDFLSRLELDYGMSVKSLSVTSANSSGIVNARLKFGK